MNVKWVLPLLCLLVGGCAATPAGPSPGLSVELTGASAEGDQITTSIEGAQVVVDVYSERGIGGAEISAPGGEWPQRLLLRLHLGGLESFEVSNGEFTIHTQLQSHPPYTQMCEVFVGDGGQGTPVDQNSAYYIPLQIVSGQVSGEATIPIEEGYIELALPAVLFEPEPETLSIEWIDFYRG